MEITELVNQAFGFMEDKIVADQIDAALEGIIEKYNAEFYPFEVRQSGGGWQFLTKKDFHKTVAQLNGEKFLKRLSAAALETLAIVAYKQPVTKGEIEAIRGVSSDYAVQKLLEKELIIISGRNEKLPGHPLIYATSKNFMDYFGINSAEDLPKIKEVLADQDIAATIVRHTDFEQSEVLAVSDEGELIGGGEGEREREGEREEKTEGGEGYVNGHTFEGMEVDYGEEPPADEEATEKEDLDLIGDSSFEENEEDQDRKTGDDDENEDENEASSESSSSADEKE